MNINIEKRNVEAELASLREEMVKVSKQLSSSYIERKKLEKEIDNARKDIVLILSRKEGQIRELDLFHSEKVRIWKETIEGEKRECEKLKKERKELISLLESLNLRIMQSEICFQDLENKKEALSGEMPLLEQRKQEREKLDEEIVELKKKHEDASLKYNEVLDKSKKIIGEMQHQVLTAQNKVAESEKRAADAEIRYKMYIREHLTRKNDIEIHRQRVEARIREIMPNFNLKLK